MGATEDTFYARATADGFALERGVAVPWLSSLGHLNASISSDAVAEKLRALHAQLGGDEVLLASKRPGSPPRLDFVWSERHLIIEIDEIQHFTTDRLATIHAYPDDASLAFDIESYGAVVERWRRRADRYRAAKPASDFPFAGGRRAQRAYFDACRDLSAPQAELRVLRIPAPECDGVLAFRRFVEALDELPYAA